MQFYRFASWFYVAIASLVVPLLVLDIVVDRLELSAVWSTLFVLSAPLMVIQALGLRRVLRDRAPQVQVSTLVTWFWLLHLSGLLLVALAVAFYWADKGAWAFWALVIGVLPMFGVSVGVGVVKLVLGARLGKCPDDLFGLRGALSIAFIIFGALELANMVVFISLPFYMVVAMALIFLIAFVIEGHARPLAPRFGVKQVWGSYVLAAVVTLGAPLAALPILLDSVSEELEQMFSSDDEEEEQVEEYAAPADPDMPESP